MFEGWTVTEDGVLHRRTGTVVPQHNKKNGYYRLRYKGKSYYQHRVVFFLTHGYWPTEVDHIDRNKLNNRPDNLREATRSEQSLNRDVWVCKNVRGVTYDKQKKRWKAQRIIAGVRHSKRFKTETEALQYRAYLETL